ncbi:PREDICTED: uncharacterized protein LOC104591993 [Nelumbo nucifera]|uniref:UDP-N-acetylmuramate dehydrogenase n=1 Tax=Nelumbo nucifera TaxID=4432 RepID=A0A1U8Q0L2_NELNU|nr:PREDICTED: uncharacterized protein LOC104591993 [Nelumbo nucifera]
MERKPSPSPSAGKLFLPFATLDNSGSVHQRTDVVIAHCDIFNLIASLYCCERCIPFIIVGNGSNCLFDDSGFEGCVILNRIGFPERIEPDIYRVGSGYQFNRLGVQCTNEGFSGLEFASGIPGTVGGAAYMNAGTNGQETVDAIDTVEIVTVDGGHKILYRSDLAFGYHMSPSQAMQDLAAIVAVTLRLLPSASAKERQQAYLIKRRLSQPVGERTAGSVFRNPPNMRFSAGELIEKAGLKGFRAFSSKPAAQIPERSLILLAWSRQKLKRNLEYDSKEKYNMLVHFVNMH